MLELDPLGIRHSSPILCPMFGDVTEIRDWHPTIKYSSFCMSSMDYEGLLLWIRHVNQEFYFKVFAEWNGS